MRVHRHVAENHEVVLAVDLLGAGGLHRRLGQEFLACSDVEEADVVEGGMDFGLHGKTGVGSALARLVARLDFVDDVDLALAAHDLTGRVAHLGGFDGGDDFHKNEERRCPPSPLSTEMISLRQEGAESAGCRFRKTRKLPCRRPLELVFAGRPGSFNPNLRYPMCLDRREFIRLSAGVAGAAFLGGSTAQAQNMISAPAGCSELPEPIRSLRRMTDGVAPITLDERRALIAKAQRLMAEHNIGAIYLEPGSSFYY